MASMDELEQKYLALVARIRGYRLPKAAEVRVLAEIEVHLAAGEGGEGGDPTGRCAAARGAG